MSKSFLPDSDAGLNQWLANFYKQFAAHATEFGFTASDVATVNDKVHQWDLAYDNHLEMTESARAATQTKQQKRNAAVDTIRPLVRILQASPKMTDALRAQFRITIPDSTPTVSTLAVEQNQPLASVEIGQRLRHVIKFVDQGTPKRRARPNGAAGAEIWMKIGPEAPLGPGDLTFVGTATRSGYLQEFDGRYAGQLAHYMLRWISTRGVKGPWSQTVSATIAA